MERTSHLLSRMYCESDSTRWFHTDGSDTQSVQKTATIHAQVDFPSKTIHTTRSLYRYVTITE